MKLFLNENDLTDRALSAGDRTASIGDFTGILSEELTVDVSDNDGSLSPFSQEGYLAINNFRDQTISQFNDNDVKIFEGLLYAVTQEFSKNGYRVKLSAREYVARLLDFVVEEAGSLAAGQYTVNGNHLPNANAPQVVDINNGTDVAPLPVLVAFTPSLVPRYQVNFATYTGGGAFDRITLDRGIEVSLTGGQAVIFTVPITKTFPKAFKDVLTAIGLASKLGPSFDALDAEDTAAGRTARFFMIKERKTKLREYIGMLMEYSGLILSRSSDGVFDIIRSMAYDGSLDAQTITDDEIVGSELLVTSVEKLAYGVQMLYQNGVSVDVYSATVSTDSLQQYEQAQWWTPIKGSSRNLEYPILYSSLSSATYFGQLRLTYYGRPRPQLTCQLKRSFHDDVLNRIDIAIGKLFFLSTKPANTSPLLKEPARVIAFTYNEQSQRYSSVTFELINIPRIISMPELVAPSLGAAQATKAAGFIYVTASLSGEYIIAELQFNGAKIERKKLLSVSGQFVLASSLVSTGFIYTLRLTPYTAGLAGKSVSIEV